MIDLLKNYKELHNSSGYIGSVRYQIAKKKFDVKLHLFRLFSSNGSTIIKIKYRNSFFFHRNLKFNHQSFLFLIFREPAPLFHQRMPLQNSNNNPINPNIPFNNTLTTPPRGLLESVGTYTSSQTSITGSVSIKHIHPT